MKVPHPTRQQMAVMVAGGLAAAVLGGLAATRSDGTAGLPAAERPVAQDRAPSQEPTRATAAPTPSTATPTRRAPATPATPTAAPLPTLREGSTGRPVADLQRRLHDLRYQVRAVTGTYDAETRQAVMAFQKVHGLQRDGVAGPQTLTALRHPGRVTARGTAPGLHMEVDVARQVAHLVRDGRIVRTYNVSTGTGGTPTPLGQFTVLRRIDGMRHAPLGDLWRPMYFTETGVAFHGAQPVVGFAASHGCVRMSDPSINELFDQLVPGTPVSVY